MFWLCTNSLQELFMITSFCPSLLSLSCLVTVPVQFERALIPVIHVTTLRLFRKSVIANSGFHITNKSKIYY